MWCSGLCFYTPVGRFLPIPALQWLEGNVYDFFFWCHIYTQRRIGGAKLKQKKLTERDCVPVSLQPCGAHQQKWGSSPQVWLEFNPWFPRVTCSWPFLVSFDRFSPLPGSGIWLWVPAIRVVTQTDLFVYFVNIHKNKKSCLVELYYLQCLYWN